MLSFKISHHSGTGFAMFEGYGATQVCAFVALLVPNTWCNISCHPLITVGSFSRTDWSLTFIAQSTVKTITWNFLLMLNVALCWKRTASLKIRCACPSGGGIENNHTCNSFFKKNGVPPLSKGEHRRRKDRDKMQLNEPGMQKLGKFPGSMQGCILIYSRP